MSENPPSSRNSSFLGRYVLGVATFIIHPPARPFCQVIPICSLPRLLRTAATGLNPHGFSWIGRHLELSDRHTHKIESQRTPTEGAVRDPKIKLTISAHPVLPHALQQPRPNQAPRSCTLAAALLAPPRPLHRLPDPEQQHERQWLTRPRCVVEASRTDDPSGSLAVADAVPVRLTSRTRRR
ncbi:hypothetical protein ACCO45_010459 [Purpureocillium lilacinum]|uniref:Uncharacterized protein n=1 Tax=Purpureocillium lilacinum TaxID=33203 RepID=A0ACC4DHI3_PURLI